MEQQFRIELASCDRQAHFANHYRTITLKLTEIPYSAIENILSAFRKNLEAFYLVHHRRLFTVLNIVVHLPKLSDIIEQNK